MARGSLTNLKTKTMHYKGNMLFSDEQLKQLLKRPTPDQREFEVENYDFLSSLPDLMEEAFELTRREMIPKMPLSIDASWIAHTMNGNIRALIHQAFPGMVVPTGRKSYCIILHPKCECYIKKLTRSNLMPQYNHSQTSFAMVQARAMPEQEAIPIVFIGYTSNASNDMLTGYHAVCIEGNIKHWVTQLDAIEPPNQMDATSSPDGPSITPFVRVRKQGTIIEIPQTK